MCQQPRRQHHLFWALESSHRVAILVFLCGGCHCTGLGATVLFCGSTALLRISDHMDIGLPFCFMALWLCYGFLHLQISACVFTARWSCTIFCGVPLSIQKGTRWTFLCGELLCWVALQNSCMPVFFLPLKDHRKMARLGPTQKGLDLWSQGYLTRSGWSPNPVPQVMVTGASPVAYPSSKVSFVMKNGRA